MNRIHEQVRDRNVRVGPHAFQEMIMERPTLTTREIMQALMSGEVLENYPDAPRGSKCLVNGKTDAGRPVHVVCTTGREQLFVVTVYEPKPPKFVTPTQRGPKNENG